MNMEEFALVIDGVTKKYDSFTLDNFSMKIEKGTVMGLVGQNGAGKTTLISLIMNKFRRDNGKITVCGCDNITDEPRVKNLIGYVADDEYMFYSYNLEKYEKIFSLSFDNWDDGLFKRLVGKFELDMKKKFSEYSKGMKTKAMIALALAHKPELLVMDEPTAGLDPVARLEILDILREFVADGEHSVLFSTHITSDLDKIADFITLIIDGKLVESMPIDEIEEKYAVVSCDGKPKTEAVPYLIGVRQGSGSFTALCRREDIEKLGGCTIRTPDIENLLTYNIWQRKGAAND